VRTGTSAGAESEGATATRSASSCAHVRVAANVSAYSDPGRTVTFCGAAAQAERVHAARHREEHAARLRPAGDVLHVPAHGPPRERVAADDERPVQPPRPTNKSSSAHGPALFAR
jgi:hypothetical protein